MSHLIEIPFRPHPLLRGGHLQTIATAFLNAPPNPNPPPMHLVELEDGDRLVLHDDAPDTWRPGCPSLLLVHGLCGSHQTNYMIRLAEQFLARGVRVFRLDMRGCGAGFDLAAQLNHAGRSGDLLRALERVAGLTHSGPLWAAGISLGGAQLMKMLGELGAGILRSQAVRERLQRAAAVAPPIDLVHCAGHMQRLWMRPYNRYFIYYLLNQIPPKVLESAPFVALDLRRRPRTMYELDDRITAPLSGFASASDYYSRCAALPHTVAVDVPTLVLTSIDDPIVPAGCFQRAEWSRSTQIEHAPGGGHVAFLGRGRDRYWMDARLSRWFG